MAEPRAEMEATEVVEDLAENLSDLNDIAEYMPAYRVARRLAKLLEQYFADLDNIVEKLNVSDRPKRKKNGGGEES